MKAIIGLGNPESRYERNRHNVGFMVLDRIAGAAGVAVRSRTRHSRYGVGELWGAETALVKPRTFMNRSGLAAREACRRWEIALPDLLVVYDDFALPLGKIRLRPEGSAAGHNGMASILAELGTSEIPRLRFGIGAPDSEAADFVLSDFTRGEMRVVEEGIVRSLEAIRCVWESGIGKAMSLFNSEPPEE